MISRKVLFAIKVVLAWVCLSNFAYGHGMDANFWREFLSKHYPEVSSEDALKWQDQTEELFKSFGVNHEKLSLIKQSDYFKLWQIPYGSSQHPNFENIKSIIEFWVSDLSVVSLNQFLQNTTHSNPYHIFTINLQGWIAFQDLMFSIGVFDRDPNSDRSLSAFLLRFNWGEGISTSHSKSAEFWMTWKNLFLSDQNMKTLVTDSFSESYLSSYKNHDLIQRLYISLTKELLSISLKYPELVSSDLLLDYINSEDNLLRFIFDSTIEDTLLSLQNLVAANVKISGIQFTTSVARSVVAKLVSKVIQDPNILKNERHLKLLIKEILSDPKKDKSRNTAVGTSRICEEFLR